MGALCCAHNRSVLKSIDEEEAALTGNDDENTHGKIVKDGTPEPELEYPGKAKKAANRADDAHADEAQRDAHKAGVQYPYKCESLQNCQCALNVSQILKYYIAWIGKQQSKKKSKSKARKKEKEKQSEKAMHWYIHSKFAESYSQFNYCTVSLLNDFIHIVFEHGHELSLIVNKFNVKSSEQVSSLLLLRNHRNRAHSAQRSMSSSEQQMYFGWQDCDELHTQQLLDKIYCYLLGDLHPVIRAVAQQNKSNANGAEEDEQDEKSVSKSKNEMDALIHSHAASRCEHDDDDDEYVHVDKARSDIQRTLKERKLSYRKLRGFDRVNHANKFVTTLPDLQHDEQVALRLEQQCGGVAYYYWPYFEHRADKDACNVGYQYKDWFVPKTYASLKEEVLSHGELVDVMQWDLLMKAANDYVHTHYCKAVLKCKSGAFETEYAISRGSAVSLSHLICVLLYCNHDAFRSGLLKTYRRIPVEETDEALKRRHSAFYHVAKSLRELVECFGSVQQRKNGFIHNHHSVAQKHGSDDEHDHDDDSKEHEEQQMPANTSAVRFYYHCIADSLVFVNKNIKINCPLSVTTKYEVIYMNTNDENGLILQLSHDTNQHRNSYFDCKWISDFVNENEYLLIGGHNAVSIDTVLSCKNDVCRDYKIYLDALHIIKMLIQGEFYRHSDKLNMDDTLQIVARQLITNRMYAAYADSQSLPAYIQKLTNFYFETLQSAHINFKSITEKAENGGYPFLRQLLLNTNDDDEKVTFIKVDIFKSLFPNLQEIAVDFKECQPADYKLDSRLFSYILLHLKSVKWKQMLITLPNNSYEEDKLSSTIGSFRDQFEQLNWKLIREPYQNNISIVHSVTL